MKLVLFDIDGTLLRSDGAGKRAIRRALLEVFGATGPTDYHLDGKTDKQIVRELMRLEGHGDEHIDASMQRLLDLYVGYLHQELAVSSGRARLLPGVRELLDALDARRDIILGLLTGNLEQGARAKLAAVGLDFDRFRIGAFGSDHEHRPELPAIARTRTKGQLGIDIRGEAMVVIGDTPADLTCGRSLGANAIGVATGRYSIEELMEHDLVAAFRDFSDTESVLRAILEA